MSIHVRYSNFHLNNHNDDEKSATFHDDMVKVRNQLINDVSWGSGESDFIAVKALLSGNSDWERYRPNVHLVSENDIRSFELEFPNDSFSFNTEGINHFVGTVAGDIILNNDIKSISVDDFWFDQKNSYFPGPKYGIENIYRNIIGIRPEDDRPLLAYSIKPRMGYSVNAFIKIFEAAAKGGADIIEDDERMIDPNYCKFEDRIKAASAIHQKYPQTFYSANITGPLEMMKERAKAAANAGIRFVKVDVLVTGFDALRDIAEYIRENEFPLAITVYPDVINSYRNLSRNFVLKMSRLCGADIIYAGSPTGSRNILHSNSLIFECEKVYMRHEKLRDSEKDLQGINPTLATLTNDMSAQRAEIITLIFNRCFNNKHFAFFIGYGISTSEKSITDEIKDIKNRIIKASSAQTDNYIIDPIELDKSARIKKRNSTGWEDYSQYDIAQYLGKYRRGY